ncbi:MAG: hypothetical protein AABX19_02075 [Nanoarchaeota archaeon]
MENREDITLEDLGIAECETLFPEYTDRLLFFERELNKRQDYTDIIKFGMCLYYSEWDKLYSNTDYQN